MITSKKNLRSKSGMVAVCLALLLMAAVSAHANMVPDSSFESLTLGSVWNGSQPYLYNAWTFNGNSGTATVVGNAQDGANCIKLTRTAVGDPWWNYDAVLSTYPWYNGGGIVVTAGQQYSISFWAKTDETNDSILKFSTVSLDSSVNYFSDTTWHDSSLTTAWTKYTYTYTAPTNAACVQLAFRGNLNTLGNVYVDNISMAAVPEPASMLAMLSGIAGLVGFATRRRK